MKFKKSMRCWSVFSVFHGDEKGKNRFRFFL